MKSTIGIDTFKLSESNGTLLSKLTLEESTQKSQFKSNIKSVSKAMSYDERKIVASGKYDPEEYYYNYEAYLSDEFEEDDEDEITSQGTIIEAEKDIQELTWIVDNYKNLLENEEQIRDKKKESEFEKEQKKLQELMSHLEDLPIHEVSRLQKYKKENQWLRG
jgi:hypothetical protein